jgi:hypothetical protein
MEIPPGFDETFLEWFRDRTNEAWVQRPTRPFSSYVAAGVGGNAFQQGSRWLKGLQEEAIDQIEAEWSVRFPPDYRLFLRRLHTIDRPAKGAKYRDGRHLVPTEEPSFYNWQTERRALQEMFHLPLEGLVFDVESNHMWLGGWGPRPASASARKLRVSDLVQQAPRLIPVFGHRFLLGEPCVAGNPVLSVYQSDIIIYGPNLRRYFLTEFANLLGLDSKHSMAEGAAEETYPLESIPFWGEVSRWQPTE